MSRYDEDRAPVKPDCQPSEYTSEQGGEWKPWPRDLAYGSVLAARRNITKENPQSVTIDKGTVIYKVHSMCWKVGVGEETIRFRWDCVNGWTDWVGKDQLTRTPIPIGTSSDGSTASYYELPLHSTELQDLISAKDMNAQMGEIFRATYRYGQCSHSDKMRDIKKILFYAQAEKDRLEAI